MSLSRYAKFPTLLLALIAVAAPGFAQEKAVRGKSDESNFAMTAATVEQYQEIVVRNLAIRYNLNDEQTEKTRELIKRRVQQFLRDHEEEIWPAIRDVLQYQMGLNPPQDKDEIARFGKLARPLMKLIQDAIYEGNEEWRQMLTPEQKAVHDFDLAEMKKTFERIDTNLEGWEKGNAGGGIFPTQRPAENPPQPTRPPEGLPPPPPPPDPIIEVFKPDYFETFVEEFIKEYSLSEGQIGTARSILKEFKEKAEGFRKANEDELRRMGVAFQEAQQAKDHKKIRDIENQRKKLLEPIHGYFEEMVVRLKAILSTVQLAKFEEKYGTTPPTAAAETAGPESNSGPVTKTP
ncbi:MAG: hypothetical protein J5J06_07040 [Phycisphaerae bacterium]|nr:hypothetical protein [Phycisphaerae bacterium]